MIFITEDYNTKCPPSLLTPHMDCCCRFVVDECNYLLRSEDWVEARVALGMPPLPPWDHGEAPDQSPEPNLTSRADPR